MAAVCRQQREVEHRLVQEGSAGPAQQGPAGLALSADPSGALLTSTALALLNVAFQALVLLLVLGEGRQAVAIGSMVLRPATLHACWSHWPIF